MNVQPRQLLRADEPAAIDVLGEAFVDDPLFVRLFGGIDDGVRASMVRSFLDGVVGMNRWSGGLRLGVDAPFSGEVVSAGGALAAVALVENPRVGWTGVRGRLAMLRFLPAAVALPRACVEMVNRYGTAVRRAAPSEPHHYLTMIGVRETHQAQGMASALLAAVVAAADADPTSTGVALDTENEENVALYEHKGFAMTCLKLVDDLPVYCMFRPRRNGRG